MKKILVLQVAALGWDTLTANAGSSVAGLEFQAAESIFPAVTCPVQASMRTGLYPSEHGMVMNGIYSRHLRRTAFWEQSSGLVHGERIWKTFRERGGKVGMMFWQQSLGEDVDLLLSPWPVHKHHGGLVDITYAKPDDLYDRLVERLNAKFRLMYYWGPFAQVKATEWIARATAELMSMDEAPQLLFSYLPHLDYDLQRYPGDHRRCRRAMRETIAFLQLIVDAAKANDYDVLVYGDYAIGEATDVIYPNRILREAGLMRVRNVGRMTYPNIHESEAFAVVDHEIAHVYVSDAQKIDAVRKLLESAPGDFHVLDRKTQAKLNIDHPDAGELILAGEPGTWFAYPWWEDAGEQPDYATHIDIHNKPGYDPCELFSTWNPFKVSTNTSLISGTHGTVGEHRQIAWASTFKFKQSVTNIVDLALALKEILAKVKL